MCPRAAAQQQGGAALARAAAASFAGAAGVHSSFGEEDYIDLDLSSCGGEFEFRVRRSSSADEMPCRAGVAAPSKAATKSGAKMQQEVDASGGGGGCGGGRRSAATVAPLQHSHSARFRDAPAARARAECSRRGKAARTVLQASRAFFRSLFARTSCSDERCHGAAVQARARTAPYGESKAAFGEIESGYGSIVSTATGRAAPTTLRSSIEQERLMDEEEQLAARHQRKSFSGVIRWRHASTTSPAAAKPLSSSSARRSSAAGGGGGIIGVGPALKRSNSARSESEGLIQGAIAYCKRSQQQQQQLGLARKSSVSDAALCHGPPSCWSTNPTRSAPAYCYYYY